MATIIEPDKFSGLSGLGNLPSGELTPRGKLGRPELSQQPTDSSAELAQLLLTLARLLMKDQQRRDQLTPVLRREFPQFFEVFSAVETINPVRQNGQERNVVTVEDLSGDELALGGLAAVLLQEVFRPDNPAVKNGYFDRLGQRPEVTLPEPALLGLLNYLIRRSTISETASKTGDHMASRVEDPSYKQEETGARVRVVTPGAKDLAPGARAGIPGWRDEAIQGRERPTTRRSALALLVVLAFVGGGLVADAVSPKFNVVFTPRGGVPVEGSGGEGEGEGDPIGAGGAGGEGSAGGEGTAEGTGVGAGAGTGEPGTEAAPSVTPSPTGTERPTPGAVETADLRPVYEGERLELISTETFTLPIEGKVVTVEDYGPVVRIFLDATRPTEYIDVTAADFAAQQAILEEGRTFAQNAQGTIELVDLRGVILDVNEISDPEVFYSTFDAIQVLPLTVNEDGTFTIGEPIVVLPSSLTDMTLRDPQTGESITDQRFELPTRTVPPNFDVPIIDDEVIRLGGREIRAGETVFFQLVPFGDDENGRSFASLEGSLEGHGGDISLLGSNYGSLTNGVFLGE